MKTFKKMAAQGDVLFEKIEKLPEGLKPAKAENGNYIVTHSETGHHHVVLERNAQMLIDQTNEFIVYIVANDNCEIKHLRDFDTHESIGLDKGDIVRVRRQREYTPEGFRKAQD